MAQSEFDCKHKKYFDDYNGAVWDETIDELRDRRGNTHTQTQIAKLYGF